jgi:hypothetical protein
LKLKKKASLADQTARVEKKRKEKERQEKRNVVRG